MEVGEWGIVKLRIRIQINPKEQPVPLRVLLAPPCPAGYKLVGSFVPTRVERD